MRGHNIRFPGDIRKITSELSPKPSLSGALCMKLPAYIHMYFFFIVLQ